MVYSFTTLSDKHTAHKNKISQYGRINEMKENGNSKFLHLTNWNYDKILGIIFNSWNIREFLYLWFRTRAR